jgi:hypothetical protein
MERVRESPISPQLQLYYAKNKQTHIRSYIMGSMDQVNYNYERDLLSDSIIYHGVNGSS